MCRRGFSTKGGGDVALPGRHCHRASFTVLVVLLSPSSSGLSPSPPLCGWVVVHHLQRARGRRMAQPPPKGTRIGDLLRQKQCSRLFWVWCCTLPPFGWALSRSLFGVVLLPFPPLPPSLPPPSSSPLPSSSSSRWRCFSAPLPLSVWVVVICRLSSSGWRCSSLVLLFACAAFFPPSLVWCCCPPSSSWVVFSPIYQ